VFVVIEIRRNETSLEGNADLNALVIVTSSSDSIAEAVIG
jgi:hypothetical protein